MAWIPLESNPDVMNQFLDLMGVPKDWKIVDVYGMDPELLAIVPQPVLAVMLLFPITKNMEKFLKEEKEKSLTSGDDSSKNVVYFRQYTHNACGTIALIHSVANNLDSFQLSDGPFKEFLGKIQGLSPEEVGRALVEEQDIAESHKEVAEKGQTQAPDPNFNPNHHFIAFIEKDGDLYELDGWEKSVPVKHFKTSKATLLSDTVKVIQKYMESDPDNVNFSMMALAAAVE